jgi:hypothetical protein
VRVYIIQGTNIEHRRRWQNCGGKQTDGCRSLRVRVASAAAAVAVCPELQCSTLLCISCPLCPCLVFLVPGQHRAHILHLPWQFSSTVLCIASPNKPEAGEVGAGPCQPEVQLHMPHQSTSLTSSSRQSSRTTTTPCPTLPP